MFDNRGGNSYDSEGDIYGGINALAQLANDHLSTISVGVPRHYSSKYENMASPNELLNDPLGYENNSSIDSHSDSSTEEHMMNNEFKFGGSELGEDDMPDTSFADYDPDIEEENTANAMVRDVINVSGSAEIIQQILAGVDSDSESVSGASSGGGDTLDGSDVDDADDADNANDSAKHADGHADAHRHHNPHHNNHHTSQYQGGRYKFPNDNIGDSGSDMDDVAEDNPEDNSEDNADMFKLHSDFLEHVGGGSDKGSDAGDSIGDVGDGTMQDVNAAVETTYHTYADLRGDSSIAQGPPQYIGDVNITEHSSSVEKMQEMYSPYLTESPDYSSTPDPYSSVSYVKLDLRSGGDDESNTIALNELISPFIEEGDPDKVHEDDEEIVDFRKMPKAKLEQIIKDAEKEQKRRQKKKPEVEPPIDEHVSTALSDANGLASATTGNSTGNITDKINRNMLGGRSHSHHSYSSHGHASVETGSTHEFGDALKAYISKFM